MIVEERRLRIPSLRERITAACDFVGEAARRAGLDERSVQHCELAVDEACSNVIEHGYGDEGAEQAIDIVCRNEGSRFSITVTDDSPAFDPLRRSDPNPIMDLDEREPGGWGIFFIKKVMDEVFYQYADARNSLMMVKFVREVPHGDLRPQSSRASITSPAPSIYAIAPHGRMDADLCPGVDMLISEQLSAGHKQLIVDMTDVEYVSSVGLKTLVSLWQRARAAKGDMVLAAVNPRVREVLEIIGLDMVFSIYPTLETAAASFASRMG
jgi:serine/threonine-protein kinase RsbW